MFYILQRSILKGIFFTVESAVLPFCGFLLVLVVVIQHFMTPGSLDSHRKPIYDLCSVLLHLDIYNISAFGHYVAFLRQDSGDW